MEERLGKDNMVDSDSYEPRSIPGGTAVNTQNFLYFFKHDITNSHFSIFANDGFSNSKWSSICSYVTTETN